MGSLQLVLCVFLGWFFFGFHRSLRGNGGAFFEQGRQDF